MWYKWPIDSPCCKGGFYIRLLLSANAYTLLCFALPARRVASFKARKSSASDVFSLSAMQKAMDIGKRLSSRIQRTPKEFAQAIYYSSVAPHLGGLFEWPLCWCYPEREVKKAGCVCFSSFRSTVYLKRLHVWNVSSLDFDWLKANEIFVSLFFTKAKPYFLGDEWTYESSKQAMDLREERYGKAGYVPTGKTDSLFPGTFFLAEVMILTLDPDCHRRCTPRFVCQQIYVFCRRIDCVKQSISPRRSYKRSENLIVRSLVINSCFRSLTDTALFPCVCMCFQVDNKYHRRYARIPIDVPSESSS